MLMFRNLSSKKRILPICVCVLVFIAAINNLYHSYVLTESYRYYSTTTTVLQQSTPPPPPPANKAAATAALVVDEDGGVGSQNEMEISNGDYGAFLSRPLTFFNSEIGSISRICPTHSHLVVPRTSNTTASTRSMDMHLDMSLDTRVLNLDINSDYEISLQNLMNNDFKQKNNFLSWHPCWLPPTHEHANKNANINGPMPILVRSWMKHASFKGCSVLLFVSSHIDNGSGIQVLGLKKMSQGTMVWKKLDLTLALRSETSQTQAQCKSFHSPSIIVDDMKKQLIMYIHGHQCKNEGDKTIKQPTLLFVSQDGVSWDLQSDEAPAQKLPYLLQHSFYLTVPVYSKRDGYYYAMAKTQENSVGSACLYRSKSLMGPFEQGPIMARGMRHVDLYLSSPDSMMIYVFFTLIGDMPERIILGSIDVSSGSENWMHWNLLPGPSLLQPEYWYEHGNATAKPSSAGPARTQVRELRDPRFLPDIFPPDASVNSRTGMNTNANTNEKKKKNALSGLLFYSVQGEQGIAMARLSVNLDSLHSTIIAYRNKTNISPHVLKATSLEVPPPVLKQNSNGNGNGNVTTPHAKNPTILITGVGRSGTTSLCTMFQSLHIQVSHDNDVDCGPYPGGDGAVSWYDAFKISDRRYTNVLHIVRDPLKTIASRALKCGHTFMKRTSSFYEDATDLQGPDNTCYKFALKHWVRRNSFVERHASWRERVENLKSGPLPTWNLCMAGHFGSRCPALSEFNKTVNAVPSDLNSGYANGTASKSQTQKHGLKKKKVDMTWDSLLEYVGPENRRYIRIAQEMGRRYGYIIEGEPIDYICRFTMKDGDVDKYWDCFISDD